MNDNEPVMGNQAASDRNLRTYHGKAAAVRYAAEPGEPETCKITLYGKGPATWHLPAVIDAVAKLRNGRFMPDTALQRSVAAWLVTEGFAAAARRAAVPVPGKERDVENLLLDLKALRKQIEDEAAPTPKWVAVIRASAVRDVQFDALSGSDPASEAWTDLPEAEIFLGIYDGTEAEVLRQASEYAGTVMDNIRLIRI